MNRSQITDFYQGKLRDEKHAAYARIKRTALRGFVAAVLAALILAFGAPLSTTWVCVGLAGAVGISGFRVFRDFNRRCNRLVREHELALRAVTYTPGLCKCGHAEVTHTGMRKGHAGDHHEGWGPACRDCSCEGYE